LHILLTLLDAKFSMKFRALNKFVTIFGQKYRQIWRCTGFLSPGVTQR